MSLLLATDFAPDALARWADELRQALPGETVLTQRSAAEDEGITTALVTNPPPGALQGLPRLQFIQSMWAGVDKLLRDESIPTEVLLARMVDPAMSEAMAETALWAVLSLHRDFFIYARQQADAQWAVQKQRRADEVRVAVLGLGQMGATVARRLAANGYRVTGWCTRPAGVEGIASVHGHAALIPLLDAHEIVVILLPLTPSTTALFDRDRLALMPRGACLVNLARGQHVVEADLLAALDAGHLRHAVLDVFATEPLPDEHPFWRHPRVSVLPHAAAQTDLRSATNIAVDNVKRLRGGEPVAHLVERRRGY